MEELNELIIYRGYSISLSATPEDDSIDARGVSAVAFNPVTKEKFVAESAASEDGVEFSWDASLTAKMKTGTYNLELYNGDVLYENRINFIKVKAAAPADGKSIA